jgi:hypothetical protein
MNKKSQHDVSVVIPTVGRPSLVRAVRSVWEQEFEGSIQILIGVDQLSDARPLNAVRQGPEHCLTTVLDLGYSTSTLRGGLYPTRAGGALRTILSYAANSQYVAYLDDDNWWAPNHLATLRQAIQESDWAFSYRWFVDPDTQEPLCVDRWESVGPHVGAFKPRFDGFVDTSSLMIDKLACDRALRWWCYPLTGDVRGMSEDRNVFKYLKDHHSWRATGQATSYYVISHDDVLEPVRRRWIEEDRAQASGAHTPAAVG